jgi:hypothetical protein
MIRLAAAALLCLCAGGAVAAPAVCIPYDDIVGQLTGRYSEAVVARGLSARGHAVEVWRAPDGATWSVVIVTPNGVACLVDAGADWETVTPAAAGSGS